MDEPSRALLGRLTDANWWIDNRHGLDVALAPLSSTSAMSAGVEHTRRTATRTRSARNSLPAMTGGSEHTRYRAEQIRAALVRKRWGDQIPSGVREALNRLTDAEWWVTNKVGDGRSDAIDRALAAEVPEHDRRRMAVGPLPRHTGPCEEQPEYVAAWQAAWALASEFGDVRGGEDGCLNFGQTCCASAGSHAGEQEGKREWINRRAAEIRRASFWTSRAPAEAEARSELARLERNLDGWG
jgi:hypothetical protein